MSGYLDTMHTRRHGPVHPSRSHCNQKPHLLLGTLKDALQALQPERGGRELRAGGQQDAARALLLANDGQKAAAAGVLGRVHLLKGHVEHVTIQ